MQDALQALFLLSPETLQIRRRSTTLSWTPAGSKQGSKVCAEREVHLTIAVASVQRAEAWV